MPQKDQLCGALAGLVALRAGGIAVADQDEVAFAAGTVLFDGDEQSRPAGEPSRQDFRLTLSRTSDPAQAGTSAVGLAHGIAKLGHGRLVAVPARGQWSGVRLGRLLDGVAALERVAVLANVTTAEFGAQDTPQRALSDYIATGVPPLWSSQWRVGHFVSLIGVLRGEVGTLVAIVDTYPSLGERGLHLQPVERVAAALNREGMSPGGVLLVVDEEDSSAARAAVVAAGLADQLWDNGSPSPG